jgi:hypothetical protein
MFFTGFWLKKGTDFFSGESRAKTILGQARSLQNKAVALIRVVRST